MILSHRRNGPGAIAIVALVGFGLQFAVASHSEAATFWPPDSLGAYAWPMSVQQGDTVGIYVSVRGTSYSLSVRREGATRVEYAHFNGLPAVVQPLPADSVYSRGCNWNPAVRIAIPDTWPSGVYTALVIGQDTTFSALFVLRERHPGTTSRMLLALTVATYHAYNRWGGKSLYTFNSTNDQNAYVVSLKRPYYASGGVSNFVLWEAKLIKFLESRGYKIEYCTNIDLMDRPALEQNYDLVMTCGHDEYWSREMRNTIEARIARGGNVAFFGGNTCWWQVRLQSDARMVCYKDKTLDPLYGIDNDRVTEQWWRDPVYRPENPMTGVSFRNGGYVNFDGWYLASQGYGGYTAFHTDHWIYAGTGLRDSSYFGASPPIVGYETDGALFNMVGGQPVVTGTDGTPLSFVVLGTSPGNRGNATMGIFSGPGLVFNAATIDWAVGLDTTTVVQRITLNVVNGLLERVASDPDVLPAGGDFALSVTPNPSRSGVSIRWNAGVGARARALICDVQGRVVAWPRVEPAPDGAWVRWDGSGRDHRRALPGVYFVRIESGPRSSTRRFLLLE